MKKWGLEKLAQEETEVVSPDVGAGMGTSADSDNSAEKTDTTCLSDCIYSQNPEKKCMLSSISLSQDKGLNLLCGQYQPVQQEDITVSEEKEGDVAPTGLAKVQQPAVSSPTANA